jgi:hypothetical protein
MKVIFSHKTAANAANKKVISSMNFNYFETIFAERDFHARILATTFYDTTLWRPPPAWA